ncbi:MAG: UdgX family uracil-DNA binding protein [Bryobacteraceae bacterium]
MNGFAATSAGARVERTPGTSGGSVDRQLACRVYYDLISRPASVDLNMAHAQKTSAAQWVPPSRDLQVLRVAATNCEGCDLFRHATQVVFGEGPQTAKVIMIGEQPGNDEDLKGLPFVGPAGKLLDKALEEAEVDRKMVYVTNAVKHFKFVERGKRRIHAKPTGIEISSCRPWLEAELAAVRPDLVVCLGATAAQAMMGRDFRITIERGRFFPHLWAKELTATIHPSAILRMEPDVQEAEYQLFVQDLRGVAAKMREMEKAS